MSSSEQNPPPNPQEPKVKIVRNDWRTDKVVNGQSSHDILWEFLLADNAKYLHAFQKTRWNGSVPIMSRSQVAEDAHKYFVNKGVHTRTFTQIKSKLYRLEEALKGDNETYEHKKDTTDEGSANETDLPVPETQMTGMQRPFENNTQPTSDDRDVILLSNAEVIGSIPLRPAQSGEKRAPARAVDTPEKRIKVTKEDNSDLRIKRAMIRVDAFVHFADKEKLGAEERDAFIKKILDDELQ